MRTGSTDSRLESRDVGPPCGVDDVTRTSREETSGNKKKFDFRRLAESATQNDDVTAGENDVSAMKTVESASLSADTALNSVGNMFHQLSVSASASVYNPLSEFLQSMYTPYRGHLQ